MQGLGEWMQSTTSDWACASGLSLELELDISGEDLSGVDIDKCIKLTIEIKDLT